MWVAKNSVNSLVLDPCHIQRTALYSSSSHPTIILFLFLSSELFTVPYEGNIDLHVPSTAETSLSHILSTLNTYGLCINQYPLQYEASMIRVKNSRNVWT